MPSWDLNLLIQRMHGMTQILPLVGVEITHQRCFHVTTAVLQHTFPAWHELACFDTEPLLLLP